MLSNIGPPTQVIHRSYDKPRVLLHAGYSMSFSSKRNPNGASSLVDRVTAEVPLCVPWAIQETDSILWEWRVMGIYLVVQPRPDSPESPISRIGYAKISKGFFDMQLLLLSFYSKFGRFFNYRKSACNRTYTYTRRSISVNILIVSI